MDKPIYISPEIITDDSLIPRIIEVERPDDDHDDDHDEEEEEDEEGY